MKERFHIIRKFIVRYSNPLFFVAGFIFDTFTLTRIDSTLDLIWDGGYLVIVTWLILQQEKVKRGLWVPSGVMAKLWSHESEALHFCYGGMLSAFVIFYFKSTSFSRSLVFFVLMIILMVLNEMPQIKRAGSHMRLGLYAFCMLSFMNYLWPVLLGQMGWWVFLIGWAVSAIATYFLVRKISRLEEGPSQSLWRMGASPAAVLILIAGLYFAKWIPPVPLSLQYAGIYHDVQRDGSDFVLSYQKPPWYFFWRGDERIFLARSGDAVCCFVRVFGPRRFNHQIWIHWLKEGPQGWISYDRVPLDIHGGREAGFRGNAVKSNYEPGDWRVDVETEDGRVLGGVDFTIEADSSIEERQFLTRRM